MASPPSDPPEVTLESDNDPPRFQRVGGLRFEVFEPMSIPDFLRTCRVVKTPRQAPRRFAPRRLDRRLGCHRPAARRSSSTTRATRAGPSSDPDLAEPPRATLLVGEAA